MPNMRHAKTFSTTTLVAVAVLAASIGYVTRVGAQQQKRSADCNFLQGYGTAFNLNGSLKDLKRDFLEALDAGYEFKAMTEHSVPGGPAYYTILVCRR